MTLLEKPENIIKKIIEERCIRQGFICERTGIKPEKLDYCLMGKRKMRVWEFIAICNLLNLDFSLFKDCFKSVI